MRSNVLIAVLVLGLAATLIWFFKAGRSPASQTLQAADEGTTNSLAGAQPASEPPNESSLQAVTNTQGTIGSDDATPETPDAKQEAYIATRVAELQDLGMENDSASLDTILSELNNRNPGIRKAAVAAAVQFGSRDAIPKLTDAATQTDDSEEKSAILEAINFLKLPTLTEALAQKNKPAPDASSGRSSKP
jgi:hypothetical protein